MHWFAYDSVDSTNDQARRLVESGRMGRVGCVVAREQRQGRGTRGRAWFSPRDAGVYLTVARVFDTDPPAANERFTMAAGVACATVLRDATQLDVRIKPVNDLVICDGKLGGILTESHVVAGRVRAILTGVGVNVRDVAMGSDGAQPTSLERHMAADAFSRLDVCGHASGVLQSLATAICAWHDRVIAGDACAVDRAYHELIALGSESGSGWAASGGAADRRVTS